MDEGVMVLCIRSKIKNDLERVDWSLYEYELPPRKQ